LWLSVSLEAEIAAARAVAAEYLDPGEELVGVIPAEPAGVRVYVCGYAQDGDERWLALDADGVPVSDRSLVRDAVSIAALCELAEESAGGGDIAGLRARLAELRVVENPEGIEAAEQAAAQLEAELLPPPRVATIAYLDDIGRAAAKFEQTLGESGGSPFAAAMKNGLGAADELADRVERSYKVPLD
jgi:hypothetical protein